MSMSGEITVSIITVCYNAADSIEKTIVSVLNQSYKNIEYIIVDGESADDTMNIIKKYEKKISRIICEADTGIYDAMNKAVKYAHGDLIYFLNSGDLLYDDEVIQKVVDSYLTCRNVGIIYGDIIAYDHDVHEPLRMYRSTPFHIMTRGGICHQAIFAKRELFLQLEPFHLDYRVFADYDWLLQSVYVSDTGLHYLAQPISFYQMNGYSQKNQKKCFPERLEIINKYWGYYNFNAVLRGNFLELLYFGILLLYLRLPFFSPFFEFPSKVLRITNKKLNSRI